MHFEVASRLILVVTARYYLNQRYQQTKAQASLMHRSFDSLLALLLIVAWKLVYSTIAMGLCKVCHCIPNYDLGGYAYKAALHIIPEHHAKTVKTHYLPM